MWLASKAFVIQCVKAEWCVAAWRAWSAITGTPEIVDGLRRKLAYGGNVFRQCARRGVNVINDPVMKYSAWSARIDADQSEGTRELRLKLPDV